MSENGNKPTRVDGRVCVRDKPGEISLDVNCMNDDEASSVLRSITSFIHTGQGRFIDDARDMKFEPTDDPRVCVVWNPNTKQIRFSTIGIDFWEAERLCAEALTYLGLLKFSMFNQLETEEETDGGTDNL